MLASILAGAGVYYERVRKEERLAAMLIGTSFLIGMSASFSLLNYLLLTVAGKRIDVPLAALDRALGVDWPALMRLTAQHPLIARRTPARLHLGPAAGRRCWSSLLGWRGRHESIYGYCLALTAGAAISISVWVAAPSFGAFSVYDVCRRT